jgi:hypothetical protein
VEAVQPVGDGVPVVGGEQHPQPFLHGPGRAQLAGRVIGPKSRMQPTEGPRRQPVAGAQQQSAVGPGRVPLAAAAAEPVAGDPLADLGHHVVGEPDQVEPVGDQTRVRQSPLDRRPVGGARIDGNHLHLVLPVLAAGIQPGDHRGRGPAGGLTQQSTGPGQVGAAWTRRLPAAALHLVPAHRQRSLAVGQVLRPGRALLPNRGGEHPTHRAGCRRRFGRA